MKRLTPSPEIAHVDPRRLPVDHSHPRAVAFAMFGTVVALAPCSTHAVIFNAIKTVAKPDSATPAAQNLLRTEGPKAVYRDYGLEFFPAPPRPEDLAAFAIVENELHARRGATRAGRAWIGVPVEGTKAAIVSWWVERAQVPPPTIALVLKALGLSGVVFLEFADSSSPERLVLNPKPCPNAAK